MGDDSDAAGLMRSVDHAIHGQVAADIAAELHQQLCRLLEILRMLFLDGCREYVERPHWASVDDLVERGQGAAGLLESLPGVRGSLQHQIVDIGQCRVPTTGFWRGQARFEAVDEEMDLAVVPVDRHLDSGNHNHAALPAQFDRLGNGALIVMVGDGNDLETTIGDRVDQVIRLPESVAGQGVKVEVDGISRVYW